MPLSNDSRLIARALQGFGNRPLRLIKRLSRVSHESVYVAVLASENTRAGRAANRVGAKRILKQDAFPRNSINVGRRCGRCQWATVSGNRVHGMVI